MCPDIFFIFSSPSEGLIKIAFQTIPIHNLPEAQNYKSAAGNVSMKRLISPSCILSYFTHKLRIAVMETGLLSGFGKDQQSFGSNKGV